jgi:DNA replication and repair protein RecF
LIRDRSAAVVRILEPFARACEALALGGEPAIEYRPRSRASTVEELAEEIAGRVDGDLERGFTGHGPHRDDLVILREGRDLRSYGSQGQQRLGLLALLLAERDALSCTRECAPLMLLDDVMSELDGDRREALVEVLRAGSGQAVITTTDAQHVPSGDAPDVARIDIDPGHVLRQPTLA